MIVAVGVAVLTLTAAGPAAAVAGFGDVEQDHFFAAPVQWMVENEITTGTAPGCFSPYATTTRAQAAAFFHRSLGEPNGGGESFVDVNPGDWFRDAVAWMVNEGITTGTTATTFSPEKPVTRGEMAAFMWRAEGRPNAGSEPFTDVGGHDYFRDAVAWMVNEGITTGTTATTFSPYKVLTRGEIATFLYRAAGEPSVDLGAAGQCDPYGTMTELEAAEARSLALLNDFRAANGLGTAERSAEMDDFARDWSHEMDASGDFEHSQGPWAENIAWWSAGWATPQAAADKMHEMWVNSPGHRANMLRAHHDVVGIGFWLSDDGWHATHVFR